jgi:hypothetical protein
MSSDSLGSFAGVIVVFVQIHKSAASAQPSALSVVTLAAVGATACVVADVVHEVLGHGTASWLTGNHIISLSTVATQNLSASRMVSAAGTSANAIAGILSFLLLRRFRTLTPLAYFLWVFGAFNLFNVGYLVASAFMDSGDWANVVSGLTPAWFWRLLLGFAGISLYVVGFRWAASFIINFVNQGEVAVADRRRLVWPAYFAGGVVLTLASILNPISPSLILISGIGASFGLNFGFLLLPDYVACKAQSKGAATSRVPFSAYWLVVALSSSGLFIGVLGPGIHFSN